MPYEDYKRLVQSLIDDKKYWWACYCILAFCTGLRISDLLRIKWSDILGKQKLVITAKKTGKTHSIPLGQNASETLGELYEKMDCPDIDRLILSSRLERFEGRAVSREYINKMLKKLAVKYGIDIEHFSTHTFRKTFGRYVWEKSGRDNNAILYLNRIFRHSNLQTTLIYLGVNDDEIAGVFNSIEVR